MKLELPAREVRGGTRPGVGRRPAIIALLAVMALAGIPCGPLFEPDEGRYAEIAHEMVITGDWIVPRFQGVAHVTKPPFAYYAVAGGELLLGCNVWGARLLGALAALASGLCVMHLATLLLSRRAGNLAGIIYATSLLPFAAGHIVSCDVFVTWWQLAGVTAAVHAWKRERRGARVAGLLYWACFGMAFMTKGPPGLLGMIPVMLLGWRRRRRGEPARIFSWWGLFLFLGLATWWFVVLILREPELVRYFLVDETWNRVFTDHHRRENSPLLYALVLGAGALPWSGAWPALLVRTWRSIRGARSDAALLLGGWVISSLVVFTVSRSRLALYVAPLYPAVAIGLAVVILERRPRHVPARPAAARLLLAWSVVACLLCYAARQIHTGSELSECAAAIRAVQEEGPLQLLNGTGRHLGSPSYLADLRAVPRGVSRMALLAAKDAGDLERLGLLPRTRERTVLLFARHADLWRCGLQLELVHRIFTGRRFVVLRLPDELGGIPARSRSRAPR